MNKSKHTKNSININTAINKIVVQSKSANASAEPQTAVALKETYVPKKYNWIAGP
jgi:hypothetical protein